MRNLNFLLNGVVGELAHTSMVEFMFELDKALSSTNEVVYIMPASKMLTQGEREYMNGTSGVMNWAAINMPHNGLSESQRTFIAVGVKKIIFIN